MKTRNTLIILLAPAFLLWSCGKRESAQPMDPGHAYFPVKVGSWVQYQVDSAWTDSGFDLDTSKSYMIRQVIAEAYTDPGGRPALRIERFILDNNEWVIRDVWTATRTTTGAEMTEENERRLKLSFPVREGRTWDVNVLNPNAELLVAARNVGAPYTLSGHSFASTMRVVSTVPGNIVETRDLEERYAEGVGMIEHRWFYRHLGVAVRTVTYDMVMVDYGS